MFKRKIFNIIIVLVLLGALIFFNNVLGVKNYIFRIIRPLLETAMKVRVSAFNQDTEKILEENQRFKGLLFELESLRVENSSLKKVLSFVEENKIGLKGARVIFYFQDLGKEFLIVDQGREASIQVGDLVVDSELMFLGTVKEVGGGFAKIGVAANPGETFEVEMISSRVKALARGLGAGSMAIELLPLDVPLQKGDLVGLLSKEKFLPLAEVVLEKITGGSAFKEASSVVLAHPESAREVFIISSKAPH